MGILRGTLAFALLLPALLLGALWAQRAWRTRDAFTLLTLGAVVGLSTHLVALNALCYLLRPGLAAWSLAVAEACVAAYAAREIRGQHGRPCCPRISGTWRGILPWLLPMALVWAWVAARFGGTDQLNHAAMMGVLGQGGLPVRHPYDSSSLLVYHYGSDLMGIGLAQAAGLPSLYGLNVWLALQRFLTPFLALEVLRAGASREQRELTASEGLFAVLVFGLGGSFDWLGTASFLKSERPYFTCDGLSACTLLPALAAGWVCLLGGLIAVLRWPEANSGTDQTSGLSPNSSSRALPMGMVFAAMPLAAPHAALLAGVLAAGATIVWWVRKSGPRPRPDWLLGGLLGLGVALAQGGPLTGMAFHLVEHNQAGLRWSGAVGPSFPTEAGRIVWGQPGFGQGVFSEYAHTLWGLPVLLLWTFLPRWRAPTAARWLLACGLPALGVALYADAAINRQDTARFGHVYLGLAMLVTGLALARLWQRRGSGWARLLCVAAAAFLSVQGLRVNLTHALQDGSWLPFEFDPGQVQALRYVEEHDGRAAGILAAESGQPVAPAIWGQAVSASDPGTNNWIVRSRAWRAALNCPSPANLRTAQTRWVLVAGADLQRALPLLEGHEQYRRAGAPGEFGPYRLYRYEGPWAIPEDGSSDLRHLERFPVAFLQLGEQRLTPAELNALTDGNVETIAELDRTTLAREGLTVALTTAQPVSMIWLAGRGKMGTDTILEGQNGVCPHFPPDTRVELSVLGQDGHWTRTPKPARLTRSPARSGTVLLRFEPSATPAVLLRISVPARGAEGETCALAEVWVGAATEEPLAP